MSNYVKYGDYVYFKNKAMYGNDIEMRSVTGSSECKFEDDDYTLNFAIKKL